MFNWRIPGQLSTFLIHCLPLVLMISAKVAHSAACKNRIDIVIVVDTTSSESASSFEEVKGTVKGIVSGFTIGQSNTRLALLSLSQQARVVVNLEQVNSLSDFNTAVDGLTFSTGISDLAEGMKVAKESAFDIARAQKTSKVLILVKDRRSAGVAVAAAALSQITLEVTAVKALGAAVHAVGVGGLWNLEELGALFGTEYLLFKNKDKALKSIKSLNNMLCEADCPNKGTSSQKTGLCNDNMRHIITTKINLGDNSAGLSVCKKEIQREFQSCSSNQKCTKIERNVGPCKSDGKVTIESIWQMFSHKLQTCTTTTSVQTVDCVAADSCPGQVADVLFLLDKSGSVNPNFGTLKEATLTIIDSLTIGPNNVRVGVMTFSTETKIEFHLGSQSDKSSTIEQVNMISTNTIYLTNTHLALIEARNEFARNGRADVAKFVFVITDGASTNPSETFAETARIKNTGVTLYAIGVLKPKQSELESMAAPEAATNMVLLENFEDLKPWAAKFSKKMCLELSDPNPKLCDENVFMQSVSACTNGKQQISKTVYKYNAATKCIKSTQITETQTCQEKCTDPIDGNEYPVGHKWTTLCHEFECKSYASKSILAGKSKCFAADGTCIDVGSQPFKCRDEKDAEVDNCKCVNVGGIVTAVIESG